mgnify:CR=1 FL=1
MKIAPGESTWLDSHQKRTIGQLAGLYKGKLMSRLRKVKDLLDKSYILYEQDKIITRVTSKDFSWLLVDEVILDKEGLFWHPAEEVK